MLSTILEERLEGAPSPGVPSSEAPGDSCP